MSAYRCLLTDIVVGVSSLQSLATNKYSHFAEGRDDCRLNPWRLCLLLGGYSCPDCNLPVKPQHRQVRGQQPTVSCLLLSHFVYILCTSYHCLYIVPVSGYYITFCLFSSISENIVVSFIAMLISRDNNTISVYFVYFCTFFSILLPFLKIFNF